MLDVSDVSIADVYRELLLRPPFQIVYSGPQLQETWGPVDQWRDVPTGIEITPAGWFLIVLSLLQTFFAPWGLIPYLRNGQKLSWDGITDFRGEPLQKGRDVPPQPSTGEDDKD